MSATITEAAKANSQLDASAGKITVHPAEGKGTMKAGRWDEDHQKVVTVEVPIPEPGPGQFLVKIASASL